MSTKKTKSFEVTVGHVSTPVYVYGSNGKRRYQVPYRDNGKRRLKTFTDRDEAVNHARQILSGDAPDKAPIGQIPRHLHTAIHYVIAVFYPFVKKLGIDLVEALKEYIAIRPLCSEGNFVATVKAVLEQPWIKKSRTPFREVVEKFLESKIQRRCKPKTVNKLKYCLNAAAQALGNKPLADVTTAELQKIIFVPGRSARGNRSVYSDLHNFYSWCQRNAYLRSDRTEFTPIEAPIVCAASKNILSPQQAKDWLTQIAIAGSPFETLYLAFGLFSTIRVEEVVQTEWSHVRRDSIVVVPEKAKTKAQRIVPIIPVLEAWLSPFRGLKGKLSPTLRPQSAIAKRLKQLGFKWLRNCLRHSAISYRVAVLDSVVKTADEAGNSPRVVEQHYLGKVSPADAADYYALTPEACGIHDWEQRVTKFLKTIEQPIVHKKRKKDTNSQSKKSADTESADNNS